MKLVPFEYNCNFYCSIVILNNIHENIRHNIWEYLIKNTVMVFASWRSSITLYTYINLHKEVSADRNKFQ